MDKVVRRQRSEKSATLEGNIGFLLRKAYQRNMTIFQQHSPHRDLTSVQAAALMALNDYSPCSLAELGRMAAMDPATTRGVVDRMRKRGLVSTHPGVADKREVIIRLEDEGNRLATALGTIGTMICDRTMADLNTAEQVAFEFLLRKVCGEDPA